MPREWSPLRPNFTESFRVLHAPGCGMHESPDIRTPFEDTRMLIPTRAARAWLLVLLTGVTSVSVVHAQTQYTKVRANVQCRGLDGSSSVVFNLDRIPVRLLAPISKATAVRLTDAVGGIEIPYRSYD